MGEGKCWWAWMGNEEGRWVTVGCEDAHLCQGRSLTSYTSCWRCFRSCLINPATEIYTVECVTTITLEKEAQKKQQNVHFPLFLHSLLSLILYRVKGKRKPSVLICVSVHVCEREKMMKSRRQGSRLITHWSQAWCRELWSRGEFYLVINRLHPQTVTTQWCEPAALHLKDPLQLASTLPYIRQIYRYNENSRVSWGHYSWSGSVVRSMRLTSLQQHSSKEPGGTFRQGFSKSKCPLQNERIDKPNLQRYRIISNNYRLSKQVIEIKTKHFKHKHARKLRAKMKYRNKNQDVFWNHFRDDMTWHRPTSTIFHKHY